MQPQLKNESSVLVFTLSGLNESMENRFVFFSFTALFYPLIVFCNVTVGFYPKFMYDLLSYDHVISYVGCMIQIFVIY